MYLVVFKIIGEKKIFLQHCENIYSYNFHTSLGRNKFIFIFIDD